MTFRHRVVMVLLLITVFDHGLGTRADQRRRGNDKIHDHFPPHRLVGGNFDFDYSPAPELHRGNLSHSGGINWPFRRVIGHRPDWRPAFVARWVEHGRSSASHRQRFSTGAT